MQQHTWMRAALGLGLVDGAGEQIPVPLGRERTERTEPSIIDVYVRRAPLYYLDQIPRVGI